MSPTTTNVLKGLSTLLAGGAAAGVAALTQQCGVASLGQLATIGGTAFAGALVHLFLQSPRQPTPSG